MKSKKQLSNQRPSRLGGWWWGIAVAILIVILGGVWYMTQKKQLMTSSIGATEVNEAIKRYYPEFSFSSNATIRACQEMVLYDSIEGLKKEEEIARQEGKPLNSYTKLYTEAEARACTADGTVDKSSVAPM